MTAVLAPSDPVLFGFAELVGDADPIAVAGGRTRWDMGGALAEGTRVVEAPTGIVDYQPEEMTITVRAGTTVAELDAALAERGQRSAVPDRGGTVGGALAVGENAPGAVRVGRGPHHHERRAHGEERERLRSASAHGRLARNPRTTGRGDAADQPAASDIAVVFGARE